jgi:predicted P-loop ATPase
MTPRTKEVVSVASMHKKQKIREADAVSAVEKQLGIPAAEAVPIVQQVYAASEAIDTNETLFDQLELFLRQNYHLRYNEVRRVFEDENDKSIEDADLYKMYIQARKVVDDKLRYQDFFMLIHSHAVFPKVHPIKAFFARYRQRKPSGLIDQLTTSIDTDTGFDGAEFSPSYAGRYIRKWLIGMIGTVYGDPCALVLIFTGIPNTGKTSWFRRLLPSELESYRYESVWPDNRDEQTRMCTHLMSFNDEFDGKDKARMEHFRGLTTKDYFTIREPYGKKDVRLPRLAVMCGTSNPKTVIDQAEYNRRIIPINILKVNWDVYNAIDRVDLLMEAYHAYQAGERSDMTSEDIAELRQLTEEFQNKTIEQQLVEQYLALPTGEGGEVVQYLSTTEIMSRLELRVNNRKLVLNNIGAALHAVGFTRKSKKV